MQEESWERQQKQVSVKEVAHKGLEWKNGGFPSTLMQSLQNTTPQPSLPGKLFQISLNWYSTSRKNRTSGNNRTQLIVMIVKKEGRKEAESYQQKDTAWEYCHQHSQLDGTNTAGLWKSVALLGIVERSQIYLFNCNVKSYSENGNASSAWQDKTPEHYWNVLGSLGNAIINLKFYQVF